MPIGRRRPCGSLCRLRCILWAALVPSEDFGTRTLPAILDTLVNPDAFDAQAGRARLDLAKNAGSLELALVTADTIQADALERMLAHRLATAHVLAMKAAAVMGQRLDLADQTMGTAKQAVCVEAAGMAGAVARMNGSFQAGCTRGSVCGPAGSGHGGAAQLRRRGRAGRDRWPAAGGKRG